MHGLSNGAVAILLSGAAHARRISMQGHDLLQAASSDEEAVGKHYLDAWILARGPLDGCPDSLLQDGIGVIIIAGHEVGLHQLLVTEKGVLAESEDNLEALRTNSLSQGQHLICTQSVVTTIPGNSAS